MRASSSRAMATPAVNWGDLWLLLDPSCLALIGGPRGNTRAGWAQHALWCAVPCKIAWCPTKRNKPAFWRLAAGTATAVVLVSAVRALGAAAGAQPLAALAGASKRLPSPGAFAEHSSTAYHVRPSARPLVSCENIIKLFALPSVFARRVEYELTLARMGVSSEEASVTLDGQQAAMLPLVASVSLLVVFFFFSSIQVGVVWCFVPLGVRVGASGW